MDTDIGEEVMEQIKQQGLAVFQADDSHVLVFTTETLEKLLARSIESGQGKVMVMVKHRPSV